MATPIGEYVTEIARLFPRQGKWTEDCYFALPETNYKVELAKGMLIVTPPPDPGHQDISRELFRRLDSFEMSHQLGVVYYSPIGLRLWEGTIREPDLLFLREENRHRIEKHLINAPVDWVAEIISPSSRKSDRVEKLEEYAAAGIPEYWLLDPKARSIRVYALRGSDTYTLIGTYTPGETAKSETLTGFEVEVSRIFA
jgi:Uma2 family endonuclease